MPHGMALGPSAFRAPVVLHFPPGWYDARDARAAARVGGTT